MARSIEEVWEQYDATEARLSAALSERMLDLAQLAPGMQVLDLATGRGEPALRAARRVQPGGQVLGVDPAASMLAMARARAAAEGVDNLELRASSAERLDGVPSGRFDVVTTRWGLMYMASPVDALREAKRALKPGGVLVAALWAEAERVSYYSWPRQWLPPEHRGPPIDPEAPGVFRFAELSRIHRDFGAAGLRVTRVEELAVDVAEAATPAELLEWARAFGLARLVDPLPAELQQAWTARFLAEASSLRVDGLLHLGGVTRIVVAE